MRRDKRQFVCRDEDKQAFAYESLLWKVHVSALGILGFHSWHPTSPQTQFTSGSSGDVLSFLHISISYHSFRGWWTAELETGTNCTAPTSHDASSFFVLSTPGQAIARLFSFAVSDLQASFSLSPVRTH